MHFLAPHIILALLLSILLSCESENTPTSTAGTTTDTDTDITDAIFTSKNANCQDYVENYTSTVRDVQRDLPFNGDIKITLIDGKCLFQTNAIPNHNFNDGLQTFVNNVTTQVDQYSITTTPTKAVQVTELTLALDNAIFLNGVKLDLLAAACYGVGNGKIGCNDIATPWRYDPMYADNGFGTDSHNAHPQPDGTYHYHGNPMALFHSDSAIESPVIGFAADGFPIFGSYFNDSGTIRKATSSYRLKTGAREAISGSNPGGIFDGAYRDDYQFVEGEGDLDQCNGMTVDGVYGYYITTSYPWVLGCFSGTPDSSFNKN